MPTVVRKKPGQSEDKLIADFRKKIIADDVIPEIKDREFHKKPSVLRQERLKQRRTNRYIKVNGPVSND
jgi:ribosomal protein S21